KPNQQAVDEFLLPDDDLADLILQLGDETAMFFNRFIDGCQSFQHIQPPGLFPGHANMRRLLPAPPMSIVFYKTTRCSLFLFRRPRRGCRPCPPVKRAYLSTRSPPPPAACR